MRFILFTLRKNKIGNPVNFSELARVFEKGMNFKFVDIYKKRDDVFKRKATKLTEFLNELIIAIKIESKIEGICKSVAYQ